MIGADRLCKLNLAPVADPSFFPEWQTDLPSLTDAEREACDRLKNRYLYYAADGAISEGTIHYMMLSPLLELLHLYDPPYKVRSEKPVSIQLDTADLTLEGRIDALVLQDQLWIVLIEAKQYGFSVLQALPQALAYMAAAPEGDRPRFYWEFLDKPKINKISDEFGIASFESEGTDSVPPASLQKTRFIPLERTTTPKLSGINAELVLL